MALWEGPFVGYLTVIQNDGKYQLFYRGKTAMTRAGAPDETTCYAESADGIHWTRPDLGLYEVRETTANNIIFDNSFAPVCSNFGVFLDTRPGVPESERYKGLGGTFTDLKGRIVSSDGLVGFVSVDGIHWNRLQEKAVIGRDLHPNKWSDTSMPSTFWSESEGQYVCYVRAWKDRDEEKGPNACRWIARTTSPDFVHWSPIEMMEYQEDGLPSQLYLANTFSYFRAPHIYLAITARLCDGRQVLTPRQARAIGVPQHSWKDLSDVVLMSSRGGLRYDRTFMSSFLRPGLGPQNWVTRCSFPALGVVQTGPGELSIYIERDNAQSTSHLRRYTLRLDGFASVHAPYEGGEMVTRPLMFTGNKLVINFATSASGRIHCEIQDASGKPIPGFALSDCKEIGGDEIERTVHWKGGSDVSKLAGKPVRLRFMMKDGDLFALKFK